MTSDPLPPQVYPIGHLVRVRAASDEFHVRVGAQLQRLPAADFSVWAMAHGPADHVPRPWTPPELAAQAEAVGLPDAPERLARLEDAGLVAAVLHQHPDPRRPLSRCASGARSPTPHRDLRSRWRCPG